MLSLRLPLTEAVHGSKELDIKLILADIFSIKVDRPLINQKTAQFFQTIDLKVVKLISKTVDLRVG